MAVPGDSVSDLRRNLGGGIAGAHVPHRASVLLVRRSHRDRCAPGQRAVLPGARRARRRHQFRRNRIEPRSHDRFPGGAGHDHDRVYARPDRRLDSALHHRRVDGRPRRGAARLARSCLDRADHGGTCGERAHTGRQPGNPSRVDHGARGHGAGIFRAPSRAHRAFHVPQASALCIADRLHIRAMGCRGAGSELRGTRRRHSCLCRQACRRRPAAGSVRDLHRQDARVSRARVSRGRADARPAGDPPSVRFAEPVMSRLTFDVAHMLAGSLVLVSFLQLYQDRLYALLNIYAVHALVLALSVAWQAYAQDAPHLYVTAAIALVFKAIIIPIALHRIIVRLGIHREIEKVVGVGPAMLIGMGLVALAMVVMLRVTAEADPLAREDLAFALSVVLLGLLMMVTRRNAVSQVVGFMSLENGLVLAATGAKGMPLVVEISVAFSILIAFIVIGIFLFRIRERFDTVDLQVLDSYRGERR